MTKSHTQNGGHPALTVPQETALTLILAGQNDSEIARQLDVARQTVAQWRTSNPHFVAALNAEREAIWGGACDQLRALLPQALDVLKHELAAGNATVALAILKATTLPLGLGTFGPTSAAAVERAEKDNELKMWMDGALSL